MANEGPIINRVAQSPLITFDLKDYRVEGERVIIDLADRLHMGLILREKDFREWVKGHDWEQYAGKHVAVQCTADAIVPVWAYMLVATVLEPFAQTLVFGNEADLELELYRKSLSNIDFKTFENKKIVIKGCSDVFIPESVYFELTKNLRLYADKIMYGEPCSTVPLYKRKISSTK